ncbi:MAG: hypothetical protein VW397_08130, partial [Candidatus Margulisiibacteriota bacterium]
MILVLLFIASFSPYVYSDLPLPEFNSKTVNFSTQSIKGKYGSDMNSFYTIRADARLRFHDLSFGVHALKLHLQNQDYNNLSYSFQWYFIENAIVSIFDLSTNFGYFFNDSKYSILNHYYSHFFSNWFVSNRFKVRGSPIYFLATVYDSYQDHLFYKGVLGINSDFGQVFLEYDSLLPTLFLGVAQKLNSRLILNLSINLNAIYLNDYHPMFSPEIKLDLSFFDLFFNQTKPKP